MNKIIATLVVFGVFLLLLFLVPPILMLGGFCIFLLAVIALFYPNLLVLPIFSIEGKDHARTYAVFMMIIGVFLVGSGAWAKQLPKSPKDKINYLIQHRFQTADKEADQEQLQLVKSEEIQKQQQLHTLPTAVAVKIDPETQQPIVEGKAPVFKLIDVIAGDMLQVAIDGKTYLVRLHLIDTPEIGQPFGSEAREQVRKLLAGKEIILEADQVDKNSTGYLLRYVYIVGERYTLQHLLVKKGFARVDGTAGKYEQELRRLQYHAKKKKIRIWSLDNYVQEDGFVPPQRKPSREESPPPNQSEGPTTPSEDSTTTEPEQPYYASCKEAKQAGATPLKRGDPGYRDELDNDGDGIACESKKRR
jgi:micrococcal nuclease